MLYVGIDIAKRGHVAAVVDERGKTLLEPFKFSNTADGFSRLLGKLAKAGARRDAAMVGMEATGHYWISLFDFLCRHGYDVAVINPIQTDAFRKVDTVRQAKTDSADAALIAGLMRFKAFEPSALGDEAVQALRQLSRYRSYLVEERASLKNKLTALLDLAFPEYASLFSDVFGAASMAVLKEFAVPEKVAAANVRTIEKTVREASRGRLGRARADQLKKAAKGSVGVSFDSDAMAFQIKLVVENVEFLDGQISKIEGELESKLEKTAGRWLTTIPGVGTVLASAIAGEVGDAKRFATPSKLIAYAGMDATKHQSGESDPDGHMSKRGSSHLRWALMEAADKVRENDPYFGGYYDRKITEGKHYYVALSGVARKLAGVVLSLMKEGRAYEPAPPANHRPGHLGAAK